MRNTKKKITAIAAALLLSVSGVATTATMAAPTVFAATADVFYVEFYSNGGSAVKTQEISEGSTITMPKDPTRAGYTFKGWIDSATGLPVTGTEIITSNRTYVATWQSNTFVSNFGYVANTANLTNNSSLKNKLINGVTIHNNAKHSPDKPH